MPFNTRNIIIFVGIAAIFVAIYIFFTGGSEPEDSLVSSSSSPTSSAAPDEQNTIVSSEQNQIAQDFLSLLLNIKSIKLDDSIFSDDAFNSLRDSSIVLVPDGNEGRPNPFAPLGTDNIEMLPASPNIGAPTQ